MKLRFSPRADNDLGSLAAYLSARDPQASQRVQDRLTAALELLIKHPQAGRPVGQGLRRFAVPQLPYLIFYRFDELGEVLNIITIRHGARKGEAP